MTQPSSKYFENDHLPVTTVNVQKVLCFF